jgi:hypothetical protein
VIRNQYGEPSKQTRLLVELACAQDSVEEQYGDIDSEEEPEDATFQDPSSAEENNEDLRVVPPTSL